MPRSLVRPASLCLIIIALAVTGGCSASTTSSPGVRAQTTFPPTANAKTLQLPSVHVVSKTQFFDFNINTDYLKYGYMTEACPLGEVAIGGGFTFVLAPSNATKLGNYARITESYPANGGWRITFEYQLALQATIFANCLGNAAASVSTLETDFDMPANQVSPWEQSTCPAGSMAIGGGFSVRYPIYVGGSRLYTAPDGTSGWSGQFTNDDDVDYPAGVAVVVVCYATQRPEQAGPSNVTSHTTNADQQFYYTGLTAACPAGWTMTAYMFNARQGLIYGLTYTNAPDALDAQWTMVMLTRSPLDLSMLDFSVECVQFS